MTDAAHPHVEIYIKFYNFGDGWRAWVSSTPPAVDKEGWYRLRVPVPESELLPALDAPQPKPYQTPPDDFDMAP